MLSMWCSERPVKLLLSMKSTSSSLIGSSLSKRRYSSARWCNFESDIIVVESTATVLVPIFCLLISSDSLACIFRALLSVLYAVKDRSNTRRTAIAVSGSILLRLAPIRAPAKVGGSMTTMRLQSMRGRSAVGCRFLLFINVLAIAPPNTVTLLRGMACLGKNLRIRM